MEHQSWQELAYSPAPSADGTALASSSSIAVISPSSTTNPALTIKANALFVGAVIRVYAAGRFSNTATPTLNLGLYYGGSGGTALATTGAITTTTSATNQIWQAQLVVVCRAIGTSGSLFATGWAHGLDGTAFVTTRPMGSAGAATPAAVAVDTTAAKTLDFTATWSAPSSSNTITQHLWIVEGMNCNLA